jgi:hypothetical protein
MNEKLSDLLCENGGEPYKDYRGRGCIKPTHAVTFEDGSDMMEAVVATAYDLGFEDADPEGAIGNSKLARDLGKLRQDSLGLGIIVY